MYVNEFVLNMAVYVSVCLREREGVGGGECVILQSRRFGAKLWL